MKRYMLTEPAFIGTALLAAGSIITDDDLPEGQEAEPGHYEGSGDQRVWIPPRLIPGTSMRSPPPASAIEVDANGVPKRKEDAGFAALRIPTEIAPVSPHAPNPTAPQALPPHEVGTTGDVGAQFTSGARDGVESDEAAQARADQADKIAEAAGKAAAKASGGGTQPTRRAAARTATDGPTPGVKTDAASTEPTAAKKAAAKNDAKDADKA